MGPLFHSISLNSLNLRMFLKLELCPTTHIMLPSIVTQRFTIDGSIVVQEFS
jgi:hypothetical protein